VNFIETKICSWCNIEKPLTEFYFQKKHSKKRGDWIYYHPECKQCTKDQFGIWRKENPEKRAAQQHKYDVKPTTRKLRAKNDAIYRKQGKRREWQRNNPEKLKEYRENRYHKKHDISSTEWAECKAVFNYRCAYCGMTFEEHKKRFNQNLHQEHIIHNGENDLSNCVPSCKICNSEKGTFTLEEWYNKDNPKFKPERLDLINFWREGLFLDFLDDIKELKNK
jgi:hypothetical protein